MRHFFSLFLILPILFCFEANIMLDWFSEAKMINFYKDGQQIELVSPQIEEIDNLFNEAIEEAICMPAFGVSIDSHTKEEMKSGLWIEFVFSSRQIRNDMPFDSLLIKIEKDCHGVNLIRGIEGVYEGRCFYFDLGEKNFDKLYEYLNSISEEEVEIELEKQEEKEIEIVEEDDDKKEKLLKSQKSLLEKLN